MAVLKTIKKPRTKAGKRALKARESKQIENTKVTIFVKGVKCSKIVQVSSIFKTKIPFNY